MSIGRRSRYLYWLSLELARKHKLSLSIGFLVGFIISLVLLRLGPIWFSKILAPVERIAIVGEFTPASLPGQIQNDLSLGLTTLAPDGLPGPGVAEKWEATDSGKLFLFSLRHDLKWHNGQPLTARDINYQIKDVELTVLDDYTLQIRLKDSFSPLLTLVSKPLFQKGLVGLGVFRVDSLRLKGDALSYLKLRRVEPGQTSIKEYRFYQTEAQAMLAYKLGEVDEIVDLTTSQTLSSWGQNQILATPQYRRMLTIFFNMQEPRLQEKNFRQSLAFAIPDLPGEKLSGPIPKHSWAYTDKVKHYQFDLTTAKKLFAGDKGETESASLVITTFAPYLGTAETIAAGWRQLGLNVQIKVENSLPENYQVLLTSMEVPPDPDQYLFWHSTQMSTNIAGLTNVKIDKLLEDGRQETDLNKRRGIYADFQRYLMDDLPAVFLTYQTTYHLKRGK